jgi:hypothetical protein
MPALSQEPRAARAAASTGGWVFRDRQAQRMHKFVILPKGWDRVERPPGSAAVAAWRAISSDTPNRRLRHARHDPHQAATPDTAKSDLTDNRTKFGHRAALRRRWTLRVPRGFVSLRRLGWPLRFPGF